MFRKLTGILVLILLTNWVYGQTEDILWPLGYNSNDSLHRPGVERIWMAFSDSMDVSYSVGNVFISSTCASICDSAGNLLLLSNGCYIANGEEAYIENSDSLNPGYIYNNWCVGTDTSGYYSDNTALFLQNPGDPNECLLFHISTNFMLNPLVAFDDKLRLTRVNLAEQIVMEKNTILVEDTLDNDAMHAVRHANGRDWWIILAKRLTNKYYILLFDPAGITIQEQIIGVPTAYQAGGEMVFSPDGSKLARFNTRDDLRIFDFDRCTGTLSNPVHIPIDDSADLELFAGLAFSADGRFLYAAEVQRLLQFDMQAADIAASKTIIAEVDDYHCPFQPALSYLELAPDGRIYGRNLNGSYCMHRISRPEKPGVDCMLEQNAITFFPFAFTNLPHFPNFRLGPIDGSECDTLGLDNHPLAGWRHDSNGGLEVEFTSVSWYEPDTWYWEFEDGATSTEKNSVHIFPAPGSYEVCLTVANQYGSDTRCKTILVGTTTTTLEPEPGGFRVYPNPAVNSIRLEGIEPGSRLELYSMQGRLLDSRVITESVITLGSMVPGMYVLWVKSPQGELLYTQKLVIAR